MKKKPASAAAIEKYLGSGLIKGVGPYTAKQIVSYFKDRTLEVFENSIEELMLIPGIAEKKLKRIRQSWKEHRSIRDVMIFLQKYGISTLFATKIFKTYGDEAIPIVSKNPYRLAQDIYGIGFFSADQIALSMGFERKGLPRIEAAIRHVLSASRNDGHCYLTQEQIFKQVGQLLDEVIEAPFIYEILQNLLASKHVKLRQLELKPRQWTDCFYSKALYFDEWVVAEKIKSCLTQPIPTQPQRIQDWVSKYCKNNKIQLSSEQHQAVCEIPQYPFSILTGGPGCGKTTCTKVLVKLLIAMKLQVTLAAPTGRAAQRMTEVIGLEARTIHRLLEWSPVGFKKNEDHPLTTHFLILDETSMLDISLAAHLFRALPPSAQVLFIGDPDQLPSVGAGCVLADLLQCSQIPAFRLTKIFRQAQESSIIRFAHAINTGQMPEITSPLKQISPPLPDCLFLDADEATKDQLKFIRQVQQTAQSLKTDTQQEYLIRFKSEWGGKITTTDEENFHIDQCYRPPVETTEDLRSPSLYIPDKFRHVNLSTLVDSPTQTEQLTTVLKSIHPWSSIRMGYTALETLIRVYTHSIQQWLQQKKVEIQVLSPQIRGSLGTANLNESLQKTCNPPSPHKLQITLGQRVLRLGDRVIQTRNNYDLEVFNGDIGQIVDINLKESACTIFFSGRKNDPRVTFKSDQIQEIQLAYAITIHKSQGSEFDVVIIPILGQHFNMLYRNLIYTGLTRAKKLAVFIGSRKALATAIKQVDNRKRQTALRTLVEKPSENLRP